MASTSVFINLVTTDLERSKAFYRALGCDINPDFTDENAACVVWDENIFFMVLMWDFFAAYTDKPIADPRTSAQVSVSFALDSREAVDAIVERGIAAGGTAPKGPQEYGSMYSRDLDDPDGNSLGFLHLADDAV
ncbi:VOC family protein [Microbacterium sp. Clip185]|uniref:VOC family protein n=1 Tax=Microbacterium sp. Clip185 TaxID=3025663 RepID=UPI002365BBFF|nr:VOC family protein [Microbacterium sp. Clip185]WDG18320.1 glyoxalase [Microbacterium sp. Clip185]